MTMRRPNRVACLAALRAVVKSDGTFRGSDIVLQRGVRDNQISMMLSHSWIESRGPDDKMYYLRQFKIGTNSEVQHLRSGLGECASPSEEK